MRSGAAMAVATWALAVFGALCLLLTAAAFVLDARPVVVRTGSMAPELPIGTVAVVRQAPASEARPGDVVAVLMPDGRRIMHRVQTARPAGGDSATLVLRGDANRRADAPVTTGRIERPIAVVPWLGAPIAWADGPWLQFWLGVVTGAIALSWLAGWRARRSDTVAAAESAAADRAMAPLQGPRTATAQRPVQEAS